MSHRIAQWSYCYSRPVKDFKQSLPLRQRTHLEGLQHVFETAVALFDEQGYHNTTISDIAQAAGISPATFYRWFGTKEGIFTVDPLALYGDSLLKEIVDLDDLEGSIRTLLTMTNFAGIDYIFSEPTVQAAIFTAGDSYAETIAGLLAPRIGDTLLASVVARSFVFGVYFGCMQHWHATGRTEDLAELMIRTAADSGLFAAMRQRIDVTAPTTTAAGAVTRM